MTRYWLLFFLRFAELRMRVFDRLTLMSSFRADDLKRRLAQLDEDEKNQ